MQLQTVDRDSAATFKTPGTYMFNYMLELKEHAIKIETAKQMMG